MYPNAFLAATVGGDELAWQRLLTRREVAATKAKASSSVYAWYILRSMTRLRRLVASDKIFFLTTNLQRGLVPFTPIERELLCHTMAAVRRRRQFQLAGFVVMPDHLHLLVRPVPGEPISLLMQGLKYASGRRINVGRRSRGMLWQKGFFDRFMRTPQEFYETLDYIHQNPVRKGIAERAEDWRWSSASAYAGVECIIPVDFIDLPAQSEKPLR